ncbi:MAG: nitroreductase family protein [Deltaproteobacteria bacterium]|jgi:nitroreductase|nr:nitroreductase family protein [Deltaproteobacteria bacterium]
MNKDLKWLVERRSVRVFKPLSVPDELLKEVLDAASYAPTARGTQAWHATAVIGLDRISEFTLKLREAVQKPGFDLYKEVVSNKAYSVNFGTAPVFVIVGAHRKDSYWPVEDGALVLGYLLLAAHVVGLGGCWINQVASAADEPDFRSYLTSLGFPHDYRVIGSACLGFPERDLPKPPARKPGLYNIVT